MIGAIGYMASVVPGGSSSGLGASSTGGSIVGDIFGGILGPISELVKAGAGSAVPIAAMTGNKQAKEILANQSAAQMEALRIQAMQAEAQRSSGVIGPVATWVGLGAIGVALSIALAVAASKKGAKRR